LQPATRLASVPDMFKKILIANRGEIACRIIKTARRMGIKTVAVYSQADARALHVDMADEAVDIGPAAAADSYLLIANMIEACRQTGAQAVHPGYGFLSERAAFPLALAEAGITFIGPHAAAIDAMGDKIASKKAAAAARVSTVPGFMGIIADSDEAVKIAMEIGYPVMLKASAGGGGKGMRIAHNVVETREGFALAKAEAKSSFGDDRLFIEKFITNPRHIEIQILGDKHGNVIHLGERECSIQRRNQKVIEEAPSPLLTEATRQKMGAQAVALAKAVNYDSAGTVEFVAGQDQSFYFLEMNTRLQVEHPVTELVTGVDLVEQMIRVAAGEPLAMRQKDVTLKGWAVESRIYAEDPYRGFLPSTGRLVQYRPPTEKSEAGITVRNDTGVFEGGEISIWYDPMIAKLCTHAPTRTEAIEAMSAALDQFVISGIRHNIPFLSAIMQNARWQEGTLSTGFISEEFPSGFQGQVLDEITADMLAEVAAFLDNCENTRKRKISGQLNGRKVAFERNRHVRLGEIWREIDLTEAEDALAETGAWAQGQPLATLKTRHGEVTVKVEAIVNGYRLHWRGISVDAHVFTPREAELARRMPLKKVGDTAKSLRCPMPGLVMSIAVVEGQEVKAGETLAIIEAMKMQNVLRAERDTSIKKINAKAGESLGVDAVIMEFA
jgi:propionyl-CoA carboxylase alpha chain